MPAPTITIRVAQQLLDQIDDEIARSEAQALYPPYTRSSLVQVAIAEWIAKRQRSRSRRRPRKAPAKTGQGGAE